MKQNPSNDMAAFFSSSRLGKIDKYFFAHVSMTVHVSCHTQDTNTNIL